MLTEKTTIDLVQVNESGVVHVRLATVIEKNGTQITKTYARFLLEPGADLTGQDPKVVALAQAAWTPEVIAAWQASRPVENLE